MLGSRTGGRAVRRSAGQSCSTKVARLMRFLRSVAGMPDYQRHIQHLRQHHPELSIPTERQFFEDFVRARYGDGPTRCC